MKTFVEYIQYEKMSPDKLIKALDRTRKSIKNFRNRKSTWNAQPNKNAKARDLVWKYDEIIEALKDTKEGKRAWEVWCKKNALSPKHNGIDLFA